MSRRDSGGEEQSPEEFHRQRDLGFLSKGDRAFLLGDVEVLAEPDEERDGIGPQAVRRRKTRLRKKVRRALLDFSLLYASTEGTEIFRDVLSELSDDADNDAIPAAAPHLLTSLQDLLGLLFYSFTLRDNGPDLYQELVTDGPKIFLDDHITRDGEAPLVVTQFRMRNKGSAPIEEVREQFHRGDLWSPQMAEYLMHRDEITVDEFTEYYESVKGEPLVEFVEWHPDVPLLATKEEAEELWEEFLTEGLSKQEEE